MLAFELADFVELFCRLRLQPLDNLLKENFCGGRISHHHWLGLLLGEAQIALDLGLLLTLFDQLTQYREVVFRSFTSCQELDLA